MIKTLEYPITASNHANCFYYFSGLRMSFIPTSNPGERIVEITDENGKAIDPQRVYTIAVMDGGVPEENCQSVEDTGAIINDLLIETITEQKTISPSTDGRFKICEPPL